MIPQSHFILPALTTQWDA